jgi:hypothetical protein
MEDYRVLAYDSVQGLLTTAWALGAQWGSLVGQFDRVIAATKPADVVLGLDAIPRGVVVTQLQLWGHGNPGDMLFGDASLSVAQLANGLRWRMAPHAEVWFRGCAVFQGHEGQDFAVRCATALDRTVFGHAVNVSKPWFTSQSHGYGLRPGERPHWDPEITGGSYPWAPNTCSVLRMNPPRSWLQPQR